MAKEIYNEGRVVGLSAYEIYVKEFFATNPGGTPVSEREWLASSLAIGNSLLLQVPVLSTADPDTLLEFTLPANSQLCAANTIVGSFFHGNATPDADGFATVVTDYGELISNTASLSPNNLTHQIPTKTSLAWTDNDREELQGYCRILDGIVIQPGTWTNASITPPQKDLSPNLTARGTIRLHVQGQITRAFWILLTGFTIKNVVIAESGVDGSVGTDNPADGDFLGPAVFPWAAKIVFSTPMAAISSLLSGSYTRTIVDPESGSITDTSSVSATPIVDLAAWGSVSSSASIYGQTSFMGDVVTCDVSALDISGQGSAVLAVIPRGSSVVFPALHSSLLSSSGSGKIFYPVDTVAPGTAKIFESSELMTTALSYANVPHNYSLIFDANNQLRIYRDVSGTWAAVPIASSSVSQGTISGLGGATSYKYTLNVTTGDHAAKAIALVDSSGVDLNITGSSRVYTTAADGTINWERLLAALGTNGRIDPLPAKMGQLRSAIENISAGKRYAIMLSSGNIVLEEAEALPNFFCTSLTGAVAWYGTTGQNVYDQIRLDLFGFYPDDSATTGIVSTFGSLTAVSTAGYALPQTGDNWFQTFSISNSNTVFDTLVANLNPAGVTLGDGAGQYNVIKLACMPVTNYRSVSHNIDNGAPITNTPNVWAGYINVIDGNSTYDEGNKKDGIIYVRNSGQTSNASQVSVLCSATLYHSDNRPRCRRKQTNGPIW